MVRMPIAAGLIVSTLAIWPAVGQSQQPGPTPPSPQAPAGRAPDQPARPGAESVRGQPGPQPTPAGSLIPLLYVGLVAAGAATAFVVIIRRRRGGRS